MRALPLRAVLLLLLCLAPIAGCRRAPASPPPPPPQPPQISGSLAVDGLQGPVTVVRDRWGIPHITASNVDDLFFAQGLVQAQDRLFQMDLWRRASQGRLSETLGANFIERDAMTRRFQFRGNVEQEWASYGPDARRIAVAFTRGINAWIAHARGGLPEEFALAGWQPEEWRPEDLLNRTDAFVLSGNAHDEVLRARLAAAIGVDAVSRLLPVADGGPRLVAPPDVDLSAVSFVVSETVRRMGTPAFFTALAAPVVTAGRPGQPAAGQPSAPAAPQGRRADEGRGDLPLSSDVPAVVRRALADLGLPEWHGSAGWAVAPSRSATGAPLLAITQASRPATPAARYLVHLSAPGWNVIGATSPWMPGVAVGHNGHVAWGAIPSAADTQDLFVERLNPADPHQVERSGRWVDMTVELERVDVKGRTTPFRIERLYTSNGAVVALDRERHLAYTLRWAGTEPGASAELAALGLNVARNWDEFRAAVERWRMPAATITYADFEGHVAQVQAGVQPRRGQSNGLLPSPGWAESHVWRGADTSPAVLLDPRGGLVVAAAGSASRLAHLTELLSAPGERTADDLRLAQLDTAVPGAPVVQPLLAALPVLSTDVEALRQRLVSWDRRAGAGSLEGRLYAALTDAIARRLAARRVPAEFVDDVAVRLDVSELLAHPSAVWFDAPLAVDRDSVVTGALAEVATSVAGLTPQSLTFAHPLAVFDEARRRLNVGPIPRAGTAETLFATTERAVPSFRVVIDVSDWSRSMVSLAPGQSGSPASAHYDDLAARWETGEYVPLAYSPSDVRAATQDTLTLSPR